MVGGDLYPQCIIRTYRTINMLFYLTVSKPTLSKRVKIIAMVNLALNYSSILMRRLRNLGIIVEQNFCTQPSFFERITFDRGMIGKNENYVFCKGRPRQLLESTILEHYTYCTSKGIDVNK